MAKKPKQVTSVRMSDLTKQQLADLASAKGLSEGDVVAEAIARMAGIEMTVSKRIDTIYQSVSDQIQAIEIIRDYERELTPEETALYNWLYKSWEELRRLPGFWEPRISEEGDVDEQHEKTRPHDM